MTETIIITISSVVVLCVFGYLILRSLKEIEKSQRSESREVRNELNQSLKNLSDSLNKQLKLEGDSQTQKLEKVREVIEGKLKDIQSDNTQKLEKIRETVDEKLQSTLEKRLGESFKLVSHRLEQVHKGLGEMHSLSQNVGDLKKVFSNVKTRGIWGEFQLSHLLEEMFSPEQYETNVKVNPTSRDHVEFALKLPGPDDESTIWLPIDSKFPKEQYERLLDAESAANVDEIKKAKSDLEISVKSFARDIRDKYIKPPHTTNFGIMFVPTESLYAEILRIPGLFDKLNLDYRIVIAGPSSLLANLSSLQMGFKTLAIQKRSGEVWKLLSSVKGEFGKFGDILSRVKKKLDETSNTISSAESKVRNIERKLGKVETLPEHTPVSLPPDLDDGGQDKFL